MESDSILKQNKFKGFFRCRKIATSEASITLVNIISFAPKKRENDKQTE